MEQRQLSEGQFQGKRNPEKVRTPPLCAEQDPLVSNAHDWSPKEREREKEEYLKKEAFFQYDEHFKPPPRATRWGKFSQA